MNHSIIKEFREGSGTQFDPAIVDTFLEVLGEGKVNFEAMYGEPEDLSILEEFLVIETAPV